MGVSRMGIGVGVDVAVEGPYRGAVGLCVVVDFATKEVVHWPTSLDEPDEGGVGCLLGWISLNDLGVAGVGFLGLSSQHERLCCLVADTCAVAGELRHGEDGIVLVDGGRVLLLGDVGEGDLLA